MQYLSLAALKVAFADLFANRHGVLVSSHAGKMYEPLLLERKGLVDALPEALTGGKPLADVLSEEDTVHDGIGSAMYFITEAYLRSPKTSVEVREAAAKIRDAFIPELEQLRAPYVDEVHAAMQHKKDIVELEAELKLIPIADGLTLHDWALVFVASGERIGALLGQRADIDTSTRRDAGKLRSATIAILTRFRASLADELSINKNLPSDLDAKIFGLFDELAEMRARVLAARKTSSAAKLPEGEPENV